MRRARDHRTSAATDRSRSPDGALGEAATQWKPTERDVIITVVFIITIVSNNNIVSYRGAQVCTVHVRV